LLPAGTVNAAPRIAPALAGPLSIPKDALIPPKAFLFPRKSFGKVVDGCTDEIGFVGSDLNNFLFCFHHLTIFSFCHHCASIQ
jgi:hypothetical protein